MLSETSCWCPPSLWWHGMAWPFPGRQGLLLLYYAELRPLFFWASASAGRYEPIRCLYFIIMSRSQDLTRQIQSAGCVQSKLCSGSARSRWGYWWCVMKIRTVCVQGKLMMRWRGGDVQGRVSAKRWRLQPYHEVSVPQHAVFGECQLLWFRTQQCSAVLRYPGHSYIGVTWKLAEVRPWVRKPSFTTPTPGSTQWVSETLLTSDHTSSFRIWRSTRSTHASLWPWTGRRPTPRDSSAPSLTRARGHSTWG